MTRHLVFVLFILIGCGQSANNDQQTINKPIQDTTSIAEKIADNSKIDSTEKIDYRLSELSAEFQTFELIDLKEPVIEDLNGDRIPDKAIFTTHNEKLGILITDGKTQQEIKIGLGVAFEEMGDDFSWVDYWGIVKDSTTYEVIIIDSEIIGDTTIHLENPSIFVRKEEVGGGVITFRNGKYEWIHQAD